MLPSDEHGGWLNPRYQIIPAGDTRACQYLFSYKDSTNIHLTLLKRTCGVKMESVSVQ